MLTYTCTVLWPRVRCEARRRDVSRLQNLACLAIIGLMKITPSPAMEVLLGLPPLHVMTVAEAQAWIYRLMYDQQWRPKIH